MGRRSDLVEGARLAAVAVIAAVVTATAVIGAGGALMERRANGSRPEAPADGQPRLILARVAR